MTAEAAGRPARRAGRVPVLAPAADFTEWLAARREEPVYARGLLSESTGSSEPVGSATGPALRPAVDAATCDAPTAATRLRRIADEFDALL